MRLAILAVGLLLAAPTAAQTVHPAGDGVPANLLRISLEFDEPQRASVGSDLRLTTPDGGPIKGALYPQRLWSPDRHTLTVYIDPGRVKTGLALRGSIGAVLMPGETVQVRLGARILRSWSVSAAREVALQPALDSVRVPHAGTRNKLRLAFASPIDWQSRELIAVEGPARQRLDGSVALDDGERTWSFTPAQPWRAGKYALRIHPDLEDAEGNRVGRTFEARVGSADGARLETKHTFIIRDP